MPKTIFQGFDTLHSRLTPNLTESEAVKKHRESIKKCLETNFGMTNFFKTGSSGNGTSISGYSDTDYFASIPTKNLKENSASSLRLIKEALHTRFPTTGVYVDSPAVVCPFGNLNAQTTEIVPADYIKRVDGSNVYDIPDGNSGWMKAGPTAHNKYVTAVNKKLGYKVKPLIRFIKAWKYYCNVPISSFYLEIRIVKYAEKETTIEYSYDIRKIIAQLYDNDLPAVIDPTGISGYIYPCSSASKKTEAISKLKTAKTRSENARIEESNEKIKEAFYWWDKFFNGNFPSYY
ncbi:MAG: SMODS domain-containing nucleotidyltransferase [Chitinophagales bacterium]